MLAGSDGVKESVTFENRVVHWLNYARHLNLFDEHRTNDPAVIDYLLTAFVTGNLEGYTLRSRHSNYAKKYHVAVNTIKQYLGSINGYYERNLMLRKIWHKDDSSMASRLLKEWAQYDTIAQRRQRVPDKVFAAMEARKMLNGRHGFEMAMYRWATLASRGGFRQQEYAQDKPDGEPKYYHLPNGIKVLRAFAKKDFIFYAEDHVAFPSLPCEQQRDQVRSCGTHFEIQKNRQNGQIILHGRNSQYPQYCFV